MYAYKDFYGGKAHIPTPEGTPLYKPYRHVLPQSVGFLHCFGLKIGYRCCPFWSGIDYGFWGNQFEVFERIGDFSRYVIATMLVDGKQKIAH